MTLLRAEIATYLLTTEPPFLTTYAALGERFGTTGKGIGNSMWGIESTGAPWWRVVGKNGEINGPDAAEQRRLLEAEGHTFTADGRVIFP